MLGLLDMTSLFAFQLSSSKSVIAEHVEEDGESRYKIIDIIGKEDTCGPKCLRGSGTIAGETSRAYDEVCSSACCEISGGISMYSLSGRHYFNGYLSRCGHRSIPRALGTTCDPCRERLHHTDGISGIEQGTSCDIWVWWTNTSWCWVPVLCQTKKIDTCSVPDTLSIAVVPKLRSPCGTRAKY